MITEEREREILTAHYPKEAYFCRGEKRIRHIPSGMDLGVLSDERLLKFEAIYYIHGFIQERNGMCERLIEKMRPSCGKMGQEIKQ